MLVTRKKSKKTENFFGLIPRGKFSKKSNRTLTKVFASDSFKTFWFWDWFLHRNAYISINGVVSTLIKRVYVSRLFDFYNKSSHNKGLTFFVGKGVVYVPQKMKLTTKKGDKAYQRRRTEALKKQAKDSKQLQSTPPKTLKGKARYAYTQLFPILKESGFVTQADIDTVTLLCMQVQVYKEAYDHIAEDGIQVKLYELIKDNTGKVVDKELAGFCKNPSVKMLDDATKSFRGLADDLGLTPAARARLMEIVDDDDDGESMSDLLSKGSDF